MRQILFTRGMVIAVLLVIVLGSAAATPTASAQAETPVLRLAAQSFIKGNWDIVVWDRDRITNITQSPENEFAPVWSYDRRLAYLSTTGTVGPFNSLEGADASIYVWDGKTSTLIAVVGADNLTPVPPRWSYSGQLAYVGKAQNTNRVFVWNGTTAIDVLPEAESSGHPAWSADNKLAFVAKVKGKEDLYVWDGKQVVAVSSAIRIVGDPLWGPSGQIAFAGYTGGSKREILVWDGKTVINVSQSDEDDYATLAWNTNQKLAWSSESGVLVWDGRSVTRILDNPSVVTLLEGGSDNRFLIGYQDTRSRHRAALWDGAALTPLVREGETVYAESIAWSRTGQIALGLQKAGPDLPDSPGPTSITTLTIWKEGVFTPIQQQNSIDITSLTWSDDNWLAWTSPIVNGDAVGPNQVFVWNGKSAIPISSDPGFSADFPTWESLKP